VKAPLVSWWELTSAPAEPHRCCSNVAGPAMSATTTSPVGPAWMSTSARLAAVGAIEAVHASVPLGAPQTSLAAPLLLVDEDAEDETVAPPDDEVLDDAPSPPPVPAGAPPCAPQPAATIEASKATVETLRTREDRREKVMNALSRSQGDPGAVTGRW
jgi:hypothetical protein